MDVNKLIQDNMGLVYKQLHKFNRANDDDAYCYALAALGKAAMTYDSSKNVAFSTYATVCIYNGIAMYLREEAKDKKLQVVSFDEPVDDTEGLNFADMIAAPETVESEYMRKEFYEKLWQAFYVVYNSLPNERSKQVIRMWRESDFRMTQSNIANATGISQAHVSRTLSVFKHKLKKELEEYL